MTEDQKNNAIATWLMYGSKLTRRAANECSSGDDPNELVNVSGIKLAKLMGYSINEYRLKFLPAVKAMENFIGIHVDSKMVQETFFDIAIDTYTRITNNQIKLEEDKDLFRKVLHEVMEKPMNEVSDRDLDILKHYSKVLATMSSISGRQIEAPAAAFSAITEGLSKLNKQPDLHVNQDFSNNPRQYILNQNGNKENNDG
ncbi:hypothetical protein M0R01_03700 [bacterium]|nr:hypothetical protein [bacterium]